MHLEPPPYSRIPPVNASFFTPRNVCFRDGNIAYIDYFGQGLAIHEKRAGRCTVYGEDFDRVREIAYYFILSAVGEYLDGIGMHRVHAVGVTREGRASLLLLPWNDFARISKRDITMY